MMESRGGERQSPISRGDMSKQNGIDSCRVTIAARRQAPGAKSTLKIDELYDQKLR